MNYKYITEDNLENKQNYMYSEFGGNEFLNAYVSSRENVIRRTKVLGGYEHSTYKELNEIWEYIKDNSFISFSIKEKIDRYVKLFEVGKRIYTGYDNNWKPCTKNYRMYENYLLLCEILVFTYKNTNCIKYVSCLMKITDTLISVVKEMNEIESYKLSNVLEEELIIFEEIQRKTGGTR